MSSSPIVVQRDTKAWQLQVWVSFGIAVFLCAVGLAWLPGEQLEQAFMVMGYVFCLSAAFVLAKFVRDNESASRRGGGDTPMWKLVVWGGFAVAMGLTGWGLLRMEINDTYRAYLGVSWLYLVTSAFTLAKTLRDRHEAAEREGEAIVEEALGRFGLDPQGALAVLFHDDDRQGGGHGDPDPQQRGFVQSCHDCPLWKRARETGRHLWRFCLYRWRLSRVCRNFKRSPSGKHAEFTDLRPERGCHAPRLRLGFPQTRSGSGCSGEGDHVPGIRGAGTRKI